MTAKTAASGNRWYCRCVLKSLTASQYEEGGPMQGTAFILIRSVVANPDDRETFDRWYGTDHLPLIFSKVPEVSEQDQGRRRSGRKPVRHRLNALAHESQKK